MVHFSIFGSHEGQLTADSNVYVSICSAAKLRRPPLAGRLAESQSGSGGERERAGHLFVSIFSSVTVEWPTVTEEYVALLDVLRGGSLTLDDWDRLAGASGADPGSRVGSVNIFSGANTDALPSEDEELNDLSVQRHAGTVLDQAAEYLMLGIGHGGAQRLAAVRQAAAATLAAVR